MAEDFDPAEHSADEVKAELEDAPEDQKRKIAAAEASGKNRKSVLSAAGVDPGVRLDPRGRELNAWEVVPTPELEN